MENNREAFGSSYLQGFLKSHNFKSLRLYKI